MVLQLSLSVIHVLPRSSMAMAAFLEPIPHEVTHGHHVLIVENVHQKAGHTDDS